MCQHGSGTTPQCPGRTVRGAHAARPLVYTSPRNNETQSTVTQEACPTLKRGGSALCCSLSRVDSGAVAAAAASQVVEVCGLRLCGDRHLGIRCLIAQMWGPSARLE